MCQWPPGYGALSPKLCQGPLHHPSHVCDLATCVTYLLEVTIVYVGYNVKVESKHLPHGLIECYWELVTWGLGVSTKYHHSPHSHPPPTLILPTMILPTITPYKFRAYVTSLLVYD